MNIIAFFRTTRPLANIMAAIIASILLLYFPLVSMFFIVAAMLFFALIETCYLDDTQSARERAGG